MWNSLVSLLMVLTSWGGWSHEVERFGPVEHALAGWERRLQEKVASDFPAELDGAARGFPAELLPQLLELAVTLDHVIPADLAINHKLRVTDEKVAREIDRLRFRIALGLPSVVLRALLNYYEHQGFHRYYRDQPLPPSQFIAGLRLLVNQCQGLLQ